MYILSNNLEILEILSSSEACKEYYLILLIICSTVDDNEDYDNVELRNQDEEERYFDSESPETIDPNKTAKEDESEDELDAYMKTLKVE